MNKEVEKIIKEYQEYAKKNGFKLNPDKRIVEMIVKRLLENGEKHGERYCPCRTITGNSEEDEKKICTCSFHRKEIEDAGRCHCNLFIK